MANSMDDIIVYYGEFSFEKDPQKCTLVEFLKKKPEELRLFDRKVQSALKKIYHLNGTPPPLYKSFSKTEGRTLEIYCTSGGKRQNSLSRASYVPASRCIIFNNLNTTKSEEVFVDALSHELKHAENDTDEFRRIFQKADNYGKQQLAFLDEMHAYLCGIKVCHQQFPDSKNFWVNQYRQGLKEGQDPAAVEGKLLEQITAHLMNSDLYKTKYERYYPIKPSDQGISIDSLPPNLNSDAFKALKKDLGVLAHIFGPLNMLIPTTLKTPGSKVFSYLHNRQYDQVLELVQKEPKLKKFVDDFIFDREREGQCDIIMELIEQCRPLKLNISPEKLMQAKRVDLIERWWKLPQRRQLEKNPLQIDMLWFGFTEPLREKHLSLKDQQAYLKVAQFWTSHFKDLLTLPDLLSDLKKQKNYVLLKGFLELKDPDGNYYFPEQERKEFFKPKAKQQRKKTKDKNIPLK